LWQSVACNHPIDIETSRSIARMVCEDETRRGRCGRGSSRWLVERWEGREAHRERCGSGLLLLPLCCSRARPIKSQAQGPRARQPEQVRSLSCRQIIVGVVIFINSSSSSRSSGEQVLLLRLEYLLLPPHRRPRNFLATPPHRPAPMHRVGKVFHGLQGPRNKAPAAAARERRRGGMRVRCAWRELPT